MVSKYAVQSIQVMAFHTPPTRETARSTLSAGKAAVPLNCMCSTQWELPVRPVRSWREPTRYQTQKLATGAVCTDFNTTVNPFRRRVLMTVLRGIIWLSRRLRRSRDRCRDAQSRALEARAWNKCYGHL